MAVPSIAVRAVSFVLTSALVWLAYPVLAALAYLALLVAAGLGDLGMGGPIAGPFLVLLGAAGGTLCVAIAVPAALVARAVSGLKGVLAGSAVLLVLGAGGTGLTWTLADPSGNPVAAGAVLVAAATPAVFVLAVSDVAVRLITGLAVRPQPRPSGG